MNWAIKRDKCYFRSWITRKIVQIVLYYCTGMLKITYYEWKQHLKQQLKMNPCVALKKPWLTINYNTPSNCCRWNNLEILWWLGGDKEHRQIASTATRRRHSLKRNFYEIFHESIGLPSELGKTFESLTIKSNAGSFITHNRNTVILLYS